MVALYQILLASISLSIALVPCMAQDPVIACIDVGLVGDCSSFVNEFCSDLQAVQVNPQNSLSACYNLGDFRCVYSAWFNGTETANPGSFSETNCVKAITAASRDCPKGGSGYFGINEFIFTVDPDENGCRTSAFS